MTLLFGKSDYYLLEGEMMGIKERLCAFRTEMSANGNEAYLIHKGENVRYLSGFTGGEDGILLITESNQYLLTDARYWQQAQEESPFFQLIQVEGSNIDYLIDLCNPFKSVAVEADSITWEQYLAYSKVLSTEIVAGKNLTVPLRMIKDNDEIEALKGAGEAADYVFGEILKVVSPGMTENEVANLIGYYLRKCGCSKESFDTIAISGAKTAFPHGQPGDNPLKENDVLLMDYGGFFNGYAGDTTRTIFIGKPTKLFRDRYLMVLEAQTEGINYIKEGVICSEVDKRVRKVLEKFHLEEYFTHATGHGVGLEIHENPRLGKHSNTVLRENMAVTVEPGIYIPGWGVIRIEDSVCVKKNGCESFTKCTKRVLTVAK